MKEDNFARGDKIARRQFCTKGLFFTRVKKYKQKNRKIKL